MNDFRSVRRSLRNLRDPVHTAGLVRVHLTQVMYILPDMKQYAWSGSTERKLLPYTKSSGG